MPAHPLLPSEKPTLPQATAHQHPVSAIVRLLPLQPDDDPSLNWSIRLLTNAVAASGARLRMRPRLTMWHWTGDIDCAAHIAYELVDNAVRHGRPFTDGCTELRLALVPETYELTVEVDDALTTFDNFEEATTNRATPQRRTGLLWIREKAQLSWDVLRDDTGEAIGKTVQVVLPATWEASA